jgi:hypothetical protein
MPKPSQEACIVAAASLTEAFILARSQEGERTTGSDAKGIVMEAYRHFLAEIQQGAGATPKPSPTRKKSAPANRD